MLNSIKKQIAAVYVRVSTEEQASEGYSIAAQIDVLSQYCNLFNIDIFKIYKDLGVSGKDTKNRPGLQELISDSTKNQFNLVLVWKISRLSRTLKDLLSLVEGFEKNGISFSSYSEKFDTSSPVGKMTLQILGSIAEFERNTIVENVKLGLSEVKKSGRKTGGMVLGYDSIDKNLVVNEKEAEIIRLIYDLYVNKQYGITKITSYLNQKGYRTKRNNKFYKDGVGLILDNPVYVGINRFCTHNNDEYFEIEGVHETIINKNLWEAAQKRRSERALLSARRHEEGTFPLTGLIKCPDCGSLMGSGYGVGCKITKKEGRKEYRYRYYKCLNHSSRRECKANYISADRLENEVLLYIESIIKSSELIKDALDLAAHQVKSDVGPIKKEIKDLEHEVERLKQSKERYFFLFENENVKDNKSFIQRINEIDLKTDILSKKIDEYRISSDSANIGQISKKDIVRLLKQFHKVYQIAGDTDKKELVRSFIKEINLTNSPKGKKIKSIEFHFPVGENGCVLVV